MADKSGGIPKDHYVPQMYLDAFAIEGPGCDRPHIYQYMEHEVVQPRIKDVASEKHFYTTTHRETGEKSRGVDDIYTAAEEAAAGPLKHLIQSEDIKLSDNDREHLAVFLALLATRTPGFLRAAKSLAQEATKELMAANASDLDRLRKDTKKAGLDLTENRLAELHKMLTERDYLIDYGNKDYFLGRGLKSAIDLSRIYFGAKQWHLVKSMTNRVFVTSDAPVSIFRPSYVPPAMNAGYGNGTIFIPVSPKLGLLLRDIPFRQSRIEISEKWVDRFNLNTMNFSEKFAFSNIKSKQIFGMYKKANKGAYRDVRASQMKWAPYTLFQTKSVPVEPGFKTA